MATNTETTAPIAYVPRPASAAHQDSLPQRYGPWIQWFSMAAFTLAFAGWLNESWLFLFDNPIWLNRYTEYAIILGFGVWRVHAEKNPYTRRRLMVLVLMVTVFWWLIPWLMPMFEPYAGYVWSQPVFPSLHVPGTVTFFLVLGAVLLFGRRVICGWNCPCVGVRETVGFAFRGKTIRSAWAWRLRHSKWVFFILYVGLMVVTQYPPNSWTVSYAGFFYLLVAMTYFGTFFISPIVGNRFYCRFLCPYGATFGLLNHAGFYGIRMDAGRCIDCRRCEQVCDMGIPVWEQGKAFGRVTGIEDCMGCGRCVVSCPTDALEIRDVRNVFRRGLKQTGTYLLNKIQHIPERMPSADAVPRLNAPLRPADQRRRDWLETEQPLSLAELKKQASRCLDCGVPGCRSACPLGNKIPDWLKMMADGEVEKAAEIAHETNPMPEVCGRLCPQSRLCEGACTRARHDEPVNIGAIERQIADMALARQWRPPPFEDAVRPHRSVAVVGAGPAGLACAERLIRSRCRVTVYDRESEVGGLLWKGVPPFKLEKSVLERRKEILRDAGVVFRLGTVVDEALLQQLLREHDAVFLGMGAQAPRPAAFPGQSLTGVTQALDYLAEINAGNVHALAGKRVLVLGGGDTAMDCARSAIRRQAASVTIAYRGKFSAMRASPREVEAAHQEGVAFVYEHVPVRIIGAGKVTGVEFDTADGLKIIDSDTVILALGFVPDPPAWLARFGISTDEAGRICVDRHGATSHPGIYAGGDNTSGPSLAVEAMAAGRRAADAILDSFKLRQRVLKYARPLLPDSRTASSTGLAAHETGASS